MSDPAEEGRSLVLYDGLCGFCHRTMRWVASRDKADRFRFAAQESARGRAILARHGIDLEGMLAENSVYMALDYGAPGERLLTRSDVTVHMLLGLSGIWRLAGRLLRRVPKAIRDRGYTAFARNRFRFSERYESCPLPSAIERSKFLA